MTRNIVKGLVTGFVLLCILLAAVYTKLQTLEGIVLMLKNEQDRGFVGRMANIKQPSDPTTQILQTPIPPPANYVSICFVITSLEYKMLIFFQWHLTRQ